MKTYIVIPTYNERENIAALIQEIIKLKIKSLHILVVDDNSPDGTSGIVKHLARKLKNVHLLLRTANRGRGAAGKEGLLYCLGHGADVVIEMDGDFSHHPKYIPHMLKEIKNYDVVLGSRLVEGGHDRGRGMLRKLITRLANFYITVMLGIRVKDCNSGFRCFRRSLLKKVQVEKLESKGPAIIQEMLFKAHLAGARMKEIPIDFINRTKGRSKLGLRELAVGYWMVLKLKMRHLAGRI
jgi:dolichol-phosphate mannosyltransferase